MCVSPCQAVPARLRLLSEDHPGATMSVGLACAQGYEVGCAGDSTLLGSCVCPAFPPGIRMEVLVEAGSPGKRSQQALRSRAEQSWAELTPAPLSLMEPSFQSYGRDICDPSLGLLGDISTLECNGCI